MRHRPSPDTPGDPYAPAFAPVPLQRRRRGGWTAENQRLFIALLAETGSVKRAARRIGLSPRSAYRLRGKPGAGEFDLAWQAALDVRRARLRAVLAESWRGIATGNWRAEERALLAALRHMPAPRDGARVTAELRDRAQRRHRRAQEREARRAETARIRKRAVCDAQRCTDRAAHRAAGPHVRPL